MLPVGIPDRLELAEGPDELGPEHLRQQLGLATGRRRARPRSSRRSETTRSAASSRNARKCAMPSARLQVEVDARVDAALAEVAVERAVVAVLARTACGGRAGRRRAVRAGRPSPPSPPRRPACRARSAVAPRPGLAHLPERAPPAPGRRRASSPGAPRVPLQRVHQLAGLVVGLVLRRRRRTRRAASRCPSGSSVEVLGVDADCLHVARPARRRCPRSPIGLALENLRHVVAGVVDVRVAEHEQRAAPAGCGPGGASPRGS